MISKKIFLLIVVFWLLIFSGIVAYKEYTLQTGTKVMLKTVPVDPRDIFRGDYVELRYEIGTLNLSDIPSEEASFEYNDWIYLTLDLKEGYGVPKKLYKNPPGDELYIKGRANGKLHKDLRIRYGIESYFVPEGRGLEIDRPRWEGKSIDVEVAVDRFGNAAIRNLLIEGDRIDF